MEEIIKRLMRLPAEVRELLPEGYESHSGVYSLKLGTLLRYATGQLDPQEKQMFKKLWPNQALAARNLIEGEPITVELLEALIPMPVRTFEHLMAIEEAVKKEEAKLRSLEHENKR